MIGSRRIGVLAASVVSMLAFGAVSAFADADDELLTKAGGVTLRDINTVSANQPSAIELVSAETTKLEVPGVATSECTESEFGSLVTRSVASVANPQDELSVPFGVFENCTITGGAIVPAYVDTEGAAKAASGITATIADTGPGTEIKVTLTGLKLSLYIKEPATTCKFAGTITGKWTNGAGPFTEESATNQSVVDFKGQKLTSTACGTATLTAAKFFVETTSDAPDFTGASDTVFFKAPLEFKRQGNGKFNEANGENTTSPQKFFFVSPNERGNTNFECKGAVFTGELLANGPIASVLPPAAYKNCEEAANKNPATVTTEHCSYNYSIVKAIKAGEFEGELQIVNAGGTCKIELVSKECKMVMGGQAAPKAKVKYVNFAGGNPKELEVEDNVSSLSYKVEEFKGCKGFAVVGNFANGLYTGSVKLKNVLVE